MSEILVSTEWLAHRVLDAAVAVVDVRPPFLYGQGHIPGAVNLPEFYLSSANGPIAADRLASRLGALGITRATHVIACDSGEGPGAAQLFWLLTYYRHPAVSVLDGGVTKWRHEGRDWEYTEAPVEAVEYAIEAPDRTVAADYESMQARLGAPDTAFVDVRTPAEYLGFEVTAARNGHIPGAVNIEWMANLERDDAEIYEAAPDDRLRALYQTAGITPEKRVVVYCTAGHRASQSFMALKKIGYPDVAIYLPGWHEWGNRSDAPVERE